VRRAFAADRGEHEVLEEAVRLTVNDTKSGVYRRHAKSLCEMTFPDASISENERVLMSLNESRRGQLEDERTVDLIETPIERIKRLSVAEIRFFGAALDQAITAPFHLIVQQ